MTTHRQDENEVHAHANEDHLFVARIDRDGEPFDGYSEKNKEVALVLYKDR